MPDVVDLPNLTVPDLIPAQLDKFNRDSIHVDASGTFDPARAIATLAASEGQQILAADFGGDKGIVRLFSVQNGALRLTGGYQDDIQGNDGQGYLQTLQKSAQYAEAHEVPFGISWGGPMKGSKVVFHPKAETFMAELTAYEGDLQKISPAITAAINDGPAGLISGAVEAYRQHQATNVLFAINGGGLGLAVLTDNTLYAAEPGHVEGVVALNSYHQTTPCGVFGATFTCIERLGANKAGIEAQWEGLTGSYLRARDIEDRYKEGNDLARDLYDHSALVVAHMIMGSARAFDIDLTSASSAVVCHGGAFKFPHYGDRISQILTQASGESVGLILTKDYVQNDSNACLEGAAIAALQNN